MRPPCQGYGEVLNSVSGRKGDLWYCAFGGGGNPFPLGANEEGNHCLVVKRDLQRLREKTLTENQPAWRL
jgi:hypothetical protein